MGSQGTSVVNFGSFPGTSDATIAVTGQGGILSGSLVEAWLLPAATADHSADEHIVDGPTIRAGNIVAGAGFTIYAVARDGIPVPDLPSKGGSGGIDTGYKLWEHGRAASMPYGQWTVAWVWN